MKEEMFAELVESIKQAGLIRQGAKNASRRTVIGAPDVRQIRGSLGLSQGQFAEMPFAWSVLDVSGEQIFSNNLIRWENEKSRPARLSKQLIFELQHNAWSSMRSLNDFHRPRR